MQLNLRRGLQPEAQKSSGTSVGPLSVSCCYFSLIIDYIFLSLCRIRSFRQKISPSQTPPNTYTHPVLDDYCLPCLHIGKQSRSIGSSSIQILNSYKREFDCFDCLSMVSHSSLAQSTAVKGTRSQITTWAVGSASHSSRGTFHTMLHV